jgi:hypothetical protein
MTLSLVEQLEQRYRALREQSQGSTASAIYALRRAADVADALAVLATQAGQPVLAQTCSEVAMANRAQAGQRWSAATNPTVIIGDNRPVWSPAAPETASSPRTR